MTMTLENPSLETRIRILPPEDPIPAYPNTCDKNRTPQVWLTTLGVAIVLGILLARFISSQTKVEVPVSFPELKVISLQGAPEIKTLSGAWKKLTASAPLNTAYALKTDFQSRVVLRGNGIDIRIQPGSLVVMERMDGTPFFSLRYGALQARVQSRLSHYVFSTLQFRMNTFQARFYLFYPTIKKSTLILLDGETHVKTQDHKKWLLESPAKFSFADGEEPALETPSADDLQRAVEIPRTERVKKPDAAASVSNLSTPESTHPVLKNKNPPLLSSDKELDELMEKLKNLNQSLKKTAAASDATQADASNR